MRNFEIFQILLGNYSLFNLMPLSRVTQWNTKVYRTELGMPYFKSVAKIIEMQIMDKMWTKLSFYPISV